VSIQEEAQQALTEHQAFLAEDERERQERDRERNRRYLVGLVERVLEIPRNEQCLADMAGEEIVIDGLIFRCYEFHGDECGAKLQVQLPCHLCGEPCWEDVRDLVDLGGLLADPAVVVHLGYSCQRKEESEEPEGPAAPRPKRCPLVRPNDGDDSLLCLGERCAWWDSSYEVCAILVLAINLNVISHNRLGE
jgi:hypothetical protein